MFNIGDKIYHPKFGAGTIVNIEEREILKEIKRYYMIKFVIEGIEIMLPVDDNSYKKIRRVIEKEELETIFNKRSGSPKSLPPKWIDRLKLYESILSKGDPYEMADIIRDINFLSQKKQLSKSEEKVLENFILFLSSEISIVLNVSIDEGKQKIINNLLS
ncbi:MULTISPECIES: CarD family transcriptional regulator [Caloramator]|uniref:Transcriptional regulator, CarD family n=1 Tax=Caloramator proteoclasticus DSM 10124 TaxID=1121262 RepID=A0A1M4W524_9CLOT|nr:MULTISPECIES: CarD family transcriptional regulator [Caloramator]SHE76240.1 transcriptional regulator, CarD family [Caloramator proteoclasticus DSM 10124]